MYEAKSERPVGRMIEALNEKEREREEDTTFIRPGVVKDVVGKGEVIHVSVGHCWIMTGNVFGAS